LLTQYLAHLQAPGQNRAPEVHVPPSRRRRTMKLLAWVALILVGLAAAIMIPQSLYTDTGHGDGLTAPGEHNKDTEKSAHHGEHH
jgi:ferric-dicitrate binding protein FerR (iron transport regulator)